MRLLTLLSVLLLCSASLTASAAAPPTNSGATKYQVLYIKNAKPFVLVDPYDRRFRRRRQIDGGRKNAALKMKPDTWRNRRITRRPFYVMLPKGLVPPSGSSPCHNLYPNSKNLADHFGCRYLAKRVKP